MREYLLIAILIAHPLAAQTATPTGRSVAPPAWAYPLGASPFPPPDSVTPRHVPRSKVAFTESRALDRFDVVDWFPDAHAPMPASVSRGRRPSVAACGFCHLPDGGGRPENAALAGLPAEYIVQQVAAIRDGTRDLPWPGPARPMDAMRLIAAAATEEEVLEAARYFASLQPRQRSKVVETTRIPRVQPGSGLYFLTPGGGNEALGQRLVELPASAERHELHDPSVPYTAYVPLGSLRRGSNLARRGVPPATPSCSSCHGPTLRGTALAPPIAGRSASYLLRQLLAFSAGTRADSAGAPMRAVARTLTLEDMIGAAAYVGSLTPN